MIYYYTWGDEKVASSRLRVYNILPFLNREYSFKLPVEYQKGDILFIQKRVNINEMFKAQIQGAKVIYDIDDDYFADGGVKTMVEKADCVVVGSPYLKDRYCQRAIFVDDSLDWDGTIKKDYADEPKIIGWTGYGNNAEYLKDVYDTLVGKGYVFRLITTPNYKKYLTDEAVQSRKWSRETVDKDLAECDLSIYYLPKTSFTEAKGMNKLLKNWAIGLPTFVSPIPEYKRAMLEAGVDDRYLITDWDNFKFAPFEEKLRDYALTYSAENVAKKWLQIINSL